MTDFKFEKYINEETDPARVKMAMYNTPIDFHNNEMDVQDLVEIGREMAKNRRNKTKNVLTKTMIEEIFEEMSDEDAKIYLVKHLRINLEHLIGPINELPESELVED